MIYDIIYYPLTMEGTMGFCDWCADKLNAGATFIANGYNKTVDAVAYACDKTAEGISYAYDKTAEGVSYAWNKTAEGVSYAYNVSADAISDAYNYTTEQIEYITPGWLQNFGEWAAVKIDNGLDGVRYMSGQVKQGCDQIDDYVGIPYFSRIATFPLPIAVANDVTYYSAEGLDYVLFEKDKIEAAKATEQFHANEKLRRENVKNRCLTLNKYAKEEAPVIVDQIFKEALETDKNLTLTLKASGTSIEEDPIYGSEPSNNLILNAKQKNEK